MGSEMCIRDSYSVEKGPKYREQNIIDWHLNKKILITAIDDYAKNRPCPSSPQPPFQSEAKCEVCYENQFSFILKLELIIITKVRT